MTATILLMPERKGTSIIRDTLITVLADARATVPEHAPALADYVLICLWCAGYKIVPLDKADGQD